MKKLLALSLAAILIVSLVACGEKMKKNGDSDSDGEKMMAPVDLVMGTGSSGGTYFALGGAMANATGFFVIRLFHKSSFRQGSRIANILVRTHYTAICCLCQPGLKAIYSFSLSDFIRRRRTLPRVSGLSSLKTGSTTNDRLPM